VPNYRFSALDRRKQRFAGRFKPESRGVSAARLSNERNLLCFATKAVAGTGFDRPMRYEICGLQNLSFVIGLISNTLNLEKALADSGGKAV
jgi:hypothetical protein